MLTNMNPTNCIISPFNERVLSPPAKMCHSPLVGQKSFKMGQNNQHWVKQSPVKLAKIKAKQPQSRKEALVISPARIKVQSSAITHRNPTMPVENVRGSTLFVDAVANRKSILNQAPTDQFQELVLDDSLDVKESGGAAQQYSPDKQQLQLDQKAKSYRQSTIVHQPETQGSTSIMNNPAQHTSPVRRFNRTTKASFVNTQPKKKIQQTAGTNDEKQSQIDRTGIIDHAELTTEATTHGGTTERRTTTRRAYLDTSQNMTTPQRVYGGGAPSLTTTQDSRPGENFVLGALNTRGTAPLIYHEEQNQKKNNDLEINRSYAKNQLDRCNFTTISPRETLNGTFGPSFGPSEDNATIQNTVSSVPAESYTTSTVPNRSEGLQQTHIGKWLQSELQQRARIQKMAHVTPKGNYEQQVIKPKILLTPHELKEMKDDNNYLQKSRSNLELQMMKSESRDVLKEMLSARGQLDSISRANENTDEGKVKLQQKLALIQQMKRPQVLDDIKNKQDSPIKEIRGSNEGQASNTPNAVYSKLQPFVNYFSTCEITYGDAIEQRQIRHEIAQLPSDIQEAKSLVQKKKKQKMIDEIKQRVAQERVLSQDKSGTSALKGKEQLNSLKFQVPQNSHRDVFKTPASGYELLISDSSALGASTLKTHREIHPQVFAECNSEQQIKPGYDIEMMFTPEEKTEMGSTYAVNAGVGCQTDSQSPFITHQSSAMLASTINANPASKENTNRHLTSLLRKATKMEQQREEATQAKLLQRLDKKNMKTQLQRKESDTMKTQTLQATLTALNQKENENADQGFFSARQHREDNSGFFSARQQLNQPNKAAKAAPFSPGPTRRITRRESDYDIKIQRQVSQEQVKKLSVNKDKTPDINVFSGKPRVLQKQPSRSRERLQDEMFNSPPASNEKVQKKTYFSQIATTQKKFDATKTMKNFKKVANGDLNLENYQNIPLPKEKMEKRVVKISGKKPAPMRDILAETLERRKTEKLMQVKSLPTLKILFHPKRETTTS